jgi:hypothetical protein
VTLSVVLLCVAQASFRGSYDVDIIDGITFWSSPVSIPSRLRLQAPVAVVDDTLVPLAAVPPSFYKAVGSKWKPLEYSESHYQKGQMMVAHIWSEQLPEWTCDVWPHHAGELLLFGVWIERFGYI